jgi:lysophospholipid acyltransferase (LPLAT)-like uncharacterized protein
MMKQELLATFASWLIRGLAFTLRLECRDLAGYFEPSRTRPFIAGAWHNRILLLPFVFERFRRGQRLAVLTSASKDGGLLASIVKHFGIEAVRGSSSRRGGVALRELHSKLDEGCDVIITPDGPRGPVYSMSPGIVFLAAQTGLPLMCVRVELENFWALKSWDGFRIPKPFSKVSVTLQPADPLGELKTDEEFERARLRFANELSTGAESEKIPAA